jgi:hypothetical protein
MPPVLETVDAAMLEEQDHAALSTYKNGEAFDHWELGLRVPDNVALN